MRREHLIWIFAGLFFLFGVAMIAADDPYWGRLLAGLATLSLGGFALSLVADGLETGKMRFHMSVISHTDRPVLFWAAVALVTAAGIGTLVAGLWFLFFRL